MDETTKKLLDMHMKTMMIFLNNVITMYLDNDYDLDSNATANTLKACEILLQAHGYIRAEER